jgi:hypothetical protein
VIGMSGSSAGKDPEDLVFTSLRSDACDLRKDRVGRVGLEPTTQGL